jgi:IS1 family transposase/transposase-like protein
VRCELYGQAGQDNLIVRKVYGADRIRYLRCRVCRAEFSERKHTALWNSKVRETKAVAMGEHLAEGCSLKGTARLVKVDPSTVRRLNQRLGEHGQLFHNDHAQALGVEAIEADERHGYATHKGEPAWEAELMDPVSKFVISHVQGRRNEALIRTLLEDGAARLAQRQNLVLLTDGEASYATLFPEIFGGNPLGAYRPSRSTHRGRPPKIHFRIPRTLAHVQVVKHRVGSRVTHVEIRHAHGSQKRVTQALEKLGYQVANTSAIERRNGTARTMSVYQVRKSLAFARRTDTKQALGWWGVTVYNWCRLHRSLRQPLVQPLGKKSISSDHQRWH